MGTDSSVFGYVYLVTNTVNGKKYVGCTTRTVKKRWAAHCASARKNSPFAIHAAIRKYTPDRFVITVLEAVSGTRIDLMQAEIRHIATQNCRLPKGYNGTDGGGGIDHSAPGVWEKHRAAGKRLASNPEWRKRVTDGARERSSSPQWQKNNKEAALRRVTDPVWQQAQLEGVRKNALKPEWLEAQTKRNKALAEDPAWLESQIERNRAVALDPAWQEAVRKAGRKRALDPNWQKARSDALQNVYVDPEWLCSVTEANRKKAQDPVWLDRSREGARKRVARIEAMWALLPPKEREKRIKRREYYRKRRAKCTSPSESLPTPRKEAVPKPVLSSAEKKLRRSLKASEIQTKGAQGRAQDPVWRRANEVVLAKAHAASAAKAVARDAHLPLKEQARRARRRELDRLRKAARRSVPEEALKCREAVKRCLKKKRDEKLRRMTEST